MLIANPIYDAVFKYLLSDLNVAKLMLSVLLEKEILELDFLPTEITSKTLVNLSKKKSLKDTLSFTYFRIDFAAKVKHDDGSIQHIVIELQKARLVTTIRRFRNYLGEQYRNPNLYVPFTALNGVTYETGIPIYAIYILGYELDTYRNVPVLEVRHFLFDKHTKEVYEKKDEFVRSLFHEGLIILIPYLKGKYRSRIERMLRIFEDSVDEQGMHLLEINPEDYPAELRPIIHRLQKAAADAALNKQMDAEDEIMQEIKQREAELSRMRVETEEAKRKAEEAKQKVEEAQRRAEQEQKEKEQVTIRLQKAVIAMKNSGMSLSHIAMALGVREEELNAYLKS